MIRGAAAGDSRDRDRFARRYVPVVRAYLAARWGAAAERNGLDDAVQEVFVECFKEGGALAAADAGRPGGFRPFLYGVTRNVALRFEARGAREKARTSDGAVDLAEMPDSETSLSRVFDRAWAKARIRETRELHAERAREAGPEALRRVELLRLRFHDGLPIREIAGRWNVDAAGLHHEYAKARQEFKAALTEVVRFHHPGTAAEVERECADLLSLLG